MARWKVFLSKTLTATSGSPITWLPPGCVCRTISPSWPSYSLVIRRWMSWAPSARWTITDSSANVEVHAVKYIVHKGDNYRLNIMHLFHNLEWQVMYSLPNLFWFHRSLLSNSRQLLNMQIIHFNRFVKHMQSWGMSLIKLRTALLRGV